MMHITKTFSVIALSLACTTNLQLQANPYEHLQQKAEQALNNFMTTIIAPYLQHYAVNGNTDNITIRHLEPAEITAIQTTLSKELQQEGQRFIAHLNQQDKHVVRNFLETALAQGETAIVLDIHLASADDEQQIIYLTLNLADLVNIH